MGVFLSEKLEGTLMAMLEKRPTDIKEFTEARIRHEECRRGEDPGDGCSLGYGGL